MSKRKRIFIDLTQVGASCTSRVCMQCNSEITRINNTGDVPELCDECEEEADFKWYQEIAVMHSERDQRLAEEDFDDEIRMASVIANSRFGRHAYMKEDIQDQYF